MELERLEDAFILELQNDKKQAEMVNDGLRALKDGFGDLSAEFKQLSIKIGKAHVDCEGQAPCMAVPVLGRTRVRLICLCLWVKVLLFYENP